MTRRRRDAWDAAIHAIKTLRANGHVALLAGGCVRDRLLSLVPKDYDVATDATPQRVEDLFPRVRRIGAKFGVMLVRKYGHDIEVATFRAEGPYSDGRHPDRVRFGTEIEDARRRDFTINGLFLDPMEDRVIDHVGGLADLEARVLRTIGDPAKRFAEDHLRMLRAVRFAARLGFEVEPATIQAVQRLGRHLQSMSPERVWMELEAILTAPTRTSGWDLLLDTGLRDHLCAYWLPDRESDSIVSRRLDAFAAESIPAPLGLAAALCDMSPGKVADVCLALRLSNNVMKAVLWLVRSRPPVHEHRSLELADLKELMAGANWKSLLELLRADLVARGEDLAPYESVLRRQAQIAPEAIAPLPLLTGDDLANMGVSPGPRLGEILRAVYRAQLNERILTCEQAIALAREQISSRC